MLTTHPLLVPRLRKSRGYTSSYPKGPLWSVMGLDFFLTFAICGTKLCIPCPFVVTRKGIEGREKVMKDILSNHKYYFPVAIPYSSLSKVMLLVYIAYVCRLVMYAKQAVWSRLLHTSSCGKVNWLSGLCANSKNRT
jgi:hypothetical protein